MSAPLKCMFDTRAFNLMLDGPVAVEALKGRVRAYATHIQRDEINNTKDSERRAALLQVFSDVVAESVPTDSSAVWDVSRWDQASWGANDNLYSTLKADLDKLNKNKRNNVQDALIAETSIKGLYVLITDDADLIEVTKRYGGRYLSLEELLRQ